MSSLSVQKVNQVCVPTRLIEFLFDHVGRAEIVKAEERDSETRVCKHVGAEQCSVHKNRYVKKFFSPVNV